LEQPTRLLPRNEGPGLGSAPTGTDQANTLAERLARELCRTAKREGHASGADSEPGVVLDVQVGDLRILVMRRAPEHLRVSLSPREYEIARMVAQGYPNKTIAGVLEISSWTVSTHLRRIFAKLSVTSRAAMVAQLLEGGQLPADHSH
jgi:DNA-binding CsgD family transcriptional regulator